MNRLKDIRVAILLCDGFEEVEMTQPCAAFKKEGARVDIISPGKDTVKAWDHTDWSKEYPVDVHLEDANPENYDALLLPGGVMNPDKLRTYKEAVAFVTHFFDTHKPIAAICHGPWTLIETQKIANKNMTSYHSIKTDLINAGANWHDQEVVVDDGLITSRSPKDIPAFVAKVIEEFAANQ
jgi:protease I